MEFQRNWAVDELSQNEDFIKLSPREQNAVKITLAGIEKWEQTGVAPKPLKVQVASDNPFDFVKFEGVLHGMGVGIRPLKPESLDTYIFQPTPYFSDKIEASVRQRARDLIQEDPHMSELAREFFNKFG